MNKKKVGKCYEFIYEIIADDIVTELIQFVLKSIYEESRSSIIYLNKLNIILWND